MSTTADWDAIFIGSGLGCLTAAASCARAGKRALILERLGNFGGAATIYRHGSLTMEASLHETDGATVHGPNSVFVRLGLTDAIVPIATEYFYEARGGPLPAPIRIPHGLEAAETALEKALPGSRDALAAYFKEISHLHATLRDFEDLSARGPSVLAGMLFSGRLFEFLGDAARTLSQRFDAIFGDDEAAKCALGAPIAYFDDDPDKLSFAMFAGIWARYVAEGSYYFRGGSQALTMALLQTVKAEGGEARRKCTIHKILLDSRQRAAGVLYTDDRGHEHEVRAPLIFAGAAPADVAEMLPPSARTDFLTPFKSFQPAISLFNIALGLDRPASEVGVGAYSTFIYPEELQRFGDYPGVAQVFAHAPNGKVPPYVLADYGRLETGLRKEGDPYLVALCGTDRLAWWDGLDERAEQARRAAWMDALIADADSLYPGLAAAVQHREIATARTMKTRLGTPHGEVYGFRPTPSRLFGQRPTAATAVEGLWLSSAYTVSGGYSGAMHGGLIAADAALKPSLADRLTDMV